MMTEEGYEHATLVQLAQAYVTKFGSKACCFRDITPYLKLMKPEDFKTFEACTLGMI